MIGIRDHARRSKWLLCAGVSICALLLTYWPDGLLLFRYDRVALASGEFWRILSAHLVHLNGAHVCLNVLGLFLICELLWNDLSIAHALALLVITTLGISGLLWLWQPQLVWYAGLSGVLHGLWAGCALAACWRLPQAGALSEGQATVRWPLARIGAGVGLILLLVKLAIESQVGGSPQTARLIGAPVVSIAHFYGAAIGGLYVLVWWLLAWLRQRKK